MICLLVACFILLPAFTQAEEIDSALDQNVYQWAQQCRDEVLDQFNLLLSSGQLSMGQLFDTFYIPIPNTDPQKFKTQYDKVTDEILRPIFDRYLEKDDRLVFFLAVDRNGYLPTHNTRYAQPLTGDPKVDVVKNRTKRMFNDRTGLSAARNTEPYLLQKYSRDTGEQMADLSVPLYVNNRHWGAIRVGYKAQ
ncbi:MAG: chemotaxis protein [Desulfuromonas sp.]|nr:MAG: chemotaxis protein [Desulfuromonas sp.]